MYGEDVTEKWLTATQNASVLEKAYQRGYHDAMELKKLLPGVKRDDLKPCPISGEIPFEHNVNIFPLHTISPIFIIRCPKCGKATE